MTGRRSIHLKGAGIGTAGSLGILVTLAAVIAATGFSPSSLPEAGHGPATGEGTIGLPSERGGGSAGGGLDGAVAFLAEGGSAAGGALAFAGARGAAAGGGPRSGSARGGGQSGGSDGGGQSGGSGGGGGARTATTRRSPGNADPQGNARGHLSGPQAPPGHGGTPPGQANAPTRSAKPPPPTSRGPSSTSRSQAAKPRRGAPSPAPAKPRGAKNR